MRRPIFKRLVLVAFLAGGTLLQTSCAQITAETVGGITSSILNEYISSVIYDWLDLGTTFSLS